MIKPKRGRKPKAGEEAISQQSDEQGIVADSAAAAKPKRGRKPKIVYNGYEDGAEGGCIGSLQFNSDDENIIIKLNVACPTPEIPDGDIPPNAYNEDVCDSYASKPSEINFDTSVTESHAGGDDDLMGTSGGAANKHLKVIELLKDFEEKNKNNEWPQTTSIACYWCCHRFETPPFGIPIKFTESKFHVIGCFCSLECATAYNLNSKESIDEIWERHNLLHLLSKRIGYKDVLKPAPDRLALQMFGGHLSIEEFRDFCNTSKMLNINFPPMMTLTQQIEEINEADVNSDYKYIPLDTDRVNRYKEKIKLRRTKPLTTFENTLDHAMNLKFGA